MANLPRVNLLQPWAAAPVESEWAAQAIPEPQSGHGIVVDPTAMGWAPERTPYVVRPEPADTGFADYLRDYYLPNTYIPKSKR